MPSLGWPGLVVASGLELWFCFTKVSVIGLELEFSLGLRVKVFEIVMVGDSDWVYDFVKVGATKCYLIGQILFFK